MRINYTKHGQGSALVFFHGWGFDSHIWLPLIPKLEQLYQIILIDLPGFGLSPMMGWQDFKKQLLDLLPEQFAMIGWSLGGLYASKLAIEAPERVSYLMNITSSPRFILDEFWPGVPQEVFVNFYSNLSKDVQKTLAEFISLQINKQTLSLHKGNPPSMAGLESGLQILGSWDLREGLKTLNVPNCYIFGRLDPITPVKTMKAMALNYPQFTYKLFNKSAHMPFLSEQDEFIELLLGHIK